MQRATARHMVAGEMQCVLVRSAVAKRKADKEFVSIGFFTFCVVAIIVLCFLVWYRLNRSLELAVATYSYRALHLV